MNVFANDIEVKDIYPGDSASYNRPGFFVLDGKGKVYTVNRAGVTLLGLTLPEITGTSFDLLVSENERQEWFNFFRCDEQCPKNEAASVILSLLHKRGKKITAELSVILDDRCSIGLGHDFFFMEVRTMPEQIHGGNRLSDLFLHVTDGRADVSPALAKTFAQLEASKNELQKVNAFQKALLDNAGAIIISVDIDGVIQAFNPEAEKELGYKAGEVIGKYTAELYHDTSFIAGKAKELSDALQVELPQGIEILRTGTLLSMQEENEWVYVRKNGSRFPVQLSMSAMYNASGKVLGFVEVALDISKTKQIEKELQEALMKEKDLNELKSRFLSMASHEFRTPLSTILSSVCLIEKYTTTEEQPKRDLHIRRITSSVKMLTDILNDFLNIGKIEEGKILVRPAEIIVKNGMNELLGEMKNNLRKNQHIYYSHEGDLVFTTDISLLKHIVLNLLSNASKFSAEGDDIELKTYCSGSFFRLSVTDHGIGISQDDQQHLMERFFRGANAVNIQGTGLGLHIVAKYVELLDGTVQYSSEPGKGTEFMVELQQLTV